jgi:hypothetical protein
VLRLDGDRDRDVELLLRRHELSVLRRTLKKPRLNSADRMILAALARRLPRRALGGLLVRPETVSGWHRAVGRQKSLRPTAESSGSIASVVSFTNTFGQRDASRRSMVNGTPGRPAGSQPRSLMDTRGSTGRLPEGRMALGA